eukprot:10012911-Alexandrium_andersonii.AAC.1
MGVHGQHTQAPAPTRAYTHAAWEREREQAEGQNARGHADEVIDAGWPRANHQSVGERRTESWADTHT